MKRQLLLLMLVIWISGCGRAGSVGAGPWPALSDSTFAELITDLSERGRYFDTDNLISNEASYLEVVDALDRLGVHGGAYIGVGPDQNFSYIAQVRPLVAFIVDIRRDNLLQHLWFKALFVEAATRGEYLALMYGKPAPKPLTQWRDSSVAALTSYIDTVASDTGSVRSSLAAVQQAIGRAGLALSTQDRATILGIHERFIASGLDIRFRSHGRVARACYPTHRYLLTDGGSPAPASYLASEDDYQTVRRLQMDNLIIPVVGDLAGDHSLSAIADYLNVRNTSLSALYTSNVEFYLFDDGVFFRFADNVDALPTAATSVIIRSVFRRGGAVTGPRGRASCSAQSLQLVDAFADWAADERFPSYYDLIRYQPIPVP